MNTKIAKPINGRYSNRRVTMVHKNNDLYYKIEQRMKRSGKMYTRRLLVCSDFTERNGTNILDISITSMSKAKILSTNNFVMGCT